MGIENKLQVNLDEDIEANVCRTKSLMHRTSIQKYDPNHYLIMQPTLVNFTTTNRD